MSESTTTATTSWRHVVALLIGVLLSLAMIGSGAALVAVALRVHASHIAAYSEHSDGTISAVNILPSNMCSITYKYQVNNSTVYIGVWVVKCAGALGHVVIGATTTVGTLPDQPECSMLVDVAGDPFDQASSCTRFFSVGRLFVPLLSVGIFLSVVGIVCICVVGTMLTKMWRKCRSFDSVSV